MHDNQHVPGSFSDMTDNDSTVPAKVDRLVAERCDFKFFTAPPWPSQPFPVFLSG
jgi:hypothetical protein